MRLKGLLERLGENGVRARGYAAFRVALGAYLAVHFLALVPWGTELFSSAGVLPDARLSPSLALFPNLLAVADAPGAVAALLLASALAALALAAGFADRAAAVWLWYALACLVGRNPLIANPSLPYLGWMLLAHALAGPSRSARASGEWTLPAPVFACAWLVLAAGYSYSGLTKLASPSWLDGSALAAVLENPLARPTALRDALLALPSGVLRLASWGCLALELACLPLALLPRLRPLLWTVLVGFHVALLVLVDFADLTLGMLLVHAYTFDPSWLRSTLLAPRALPAP